MKMLSWRSGRDAQASAEATIAANQKEFLQRYSLVEQELKKLIQGEYASEGIFPGMLAEFQRPDPRKMFDHLVKTSGIHVGDPPRRSFFRRARETPESIVSHRHDLLIAMSVVRYVDNFLDEVLWPQIAGYRETDRAEELRAKVNRLLAAAQQIAAKNGTYIPDEMTALPKTELEIELDPQSFDSRIIELLEHKALDFQYIPALLKHGPLQLKRMASLRPEKSSQAWRWYVRSCIVDLARDFNEKHRSDTDFNLRRFLLEQKGAVDPHVLVEYVRNEIEILRKETRETFREFTGGIPALIARLEEFIRNLETTYERAKTLGDSTS